MNVDEKTVYRLAQRGELPGFKVAGTWRFKKRDIDDWIERQKDAALLAKMGPEVGEVGVGAFNLRSNVIPRSEYGRF